MTESWEPSRQYSAGTKIVYRNVVYKVIQGHRSQSDWAPDIVPALFERIGKADNDSGRRKDDSDSDDDRRQRKQKEYRGKDRKDSDDERGGRDRRDSGEYRKQRDRHDSDDERGGRDRRDSGEYRKQRDRHDSDDDDHRRREEHRRRDSGPDEKTSDQYRDEERRRNEEERNRFGQDTRKHEEQRRAEEKEGMRQNPPPRVQELSEEQWWREAQARSEAYRRDGPKSPVTWVCAEGTNIPQYAIEGGHERKQALFIARVFHDGGLHPGKAGKHLAGGCSIGYGGGEVHNSKYEVLIGDIRAVRWASPADVKSGRARAIEGGRERGGEPLYVIQTPLEGGVQPGKVALGGQYPGARVAYGGSEREVTEFKILCYQ